VFNEYVDHGISGSKESRPELNRLMSDTHQRKIDAVLVSKIDRFGRSLKHLVNSLADLSAYGVAFISLRQERVRAGLRNAKLKEKVLGRPRHSPSSARRRVRGRSLWFHYSAAGRNRPDLGARMVRQHEWAGAQRALKVHRFTSQLP
jgi:DNA invertase Pin-like site-specific DNA recombinase